MTDEIPPGRKRPPRPGEGAQPGNQNARIGCMVRGAIRRALNENMAKGRDSLHKIVSGVIDKAELEGDLAAAKEIFDRLDGRPNQPFSDPDGNAVQLTGVVKLVRPDPGPNQG